MPLPPHLARAALPLAVALALGCGQAHSESGKQDAPEAALVEVAAVGAGALTDHWTYVGEVRPLMEATLAAGAAGEIEAVNVRVGDRVAIGTALVRIDSRLARARVEAARASRAMSSEELAQAERELGRARRLGQDIVPEAEIEQNQSRAGALNSRTESLRAAVQEARERLRLHNVDAPFDAVVKARYVDPGDWVQPGQQLLELLADDQVEVIVGAAPELAPHVEIGTIVTLRRDGAEVTGKVLGVVRALDPVTRTLKVRVVPDHVADWMLVGAAVDVVFPVERGGEGVLVSRDALVRGAVDTRVLKVVDGAARPIKVEVLATAGERALVRGEGLNEGDTVVVRGNERLRPGQKLVIAD